MSELLSAVEIEPQGEATGSVIWLHGLGASGHDFVDIPPLLALPQVRFVFPHAPRKPVTLNMGLIMPAWYDIIDLGGGLRGREDEPGIRQSAEKVRALIAREEERGVPAGRVVLAGFSQGGALALHVGTRHAKALAGIMVLSAYEVLPGTRQAEETEANRRTPLLVCHGTHDPMVPWQAGHLLYETYARDGRLAEWHTFPMQHQVCMEEIEVIRDWLHARLAPPTT
jgi:phospholipase/carboxylesterase